MFVFIAGFFLLAALMFQIIELRNLSLLRDVSATSYVIFTIGFFLWGIYGINTHLIAFSVVGFSGVLLCALAISLKLMDQGDDGE